MGRGLSALVILSVTLGSVLPAPAAPAAAPASGDVEGRVESLLRQMTLEEKVDMLGGVDDFFIRGLSRLGLPPLKMADGPMGVRNFGPATAMAAGIGLAASWNPSLAEQVGTEIGRDARAKGVHFLLGPGVNIYRAPMNGRNFEYFGEDPFLASRIAVGYIKGMQAQGVSATVKHFMGNNSEFDRHNTDSIIDERTMREIYLPVFEAAVKEAHVGAIMDSYNLTNGSHMTQSAYLNREVAKGEWGFDGVLMSDWTSTYDTVAAANGGMDLEMPSGIFFNRQRLLPAIEQGKVTPATIDDKIRRILRTAVRFGWLDRDQTDLTVPRYNPRGREVALAAAREGMVLLKNTASLLPLDKNKVKSIAIIGPNAHPAVPVGGGSARVEPFAAVSFLQGLAGAVGPATKVYYHRGLPPLDDMARATHFSTAETGGEPGLRAEYFDNPDLQGSPQVARAEHLLFGQRSAIPESVKGERWTGYYLPSHPGSYDAFVAATGEDGGSYRLFVDDRLLLDNWKSHPELLGSASLSLDARPHKIVLEHRGHSRWLGGRLAMGIVDPAGVVAPEAKALAKSAEVVVVAAGFAPESESEGADRTFRLPPGQEALIREMAAANPKAVVVLTSGGGVDTSAWLDGVGALLETWYPGQEGGTALAEILFGDVNPSGRLPVTFERRFEENPVHDSYYPAAGSDRVVYREGVFVGYRGYEQRGVRPLFPLGFGLSYTTFKYGNLSVKPLPPAPAGPGPNYEVSFDVTNTGGRAGADVAQVYVGETQPRVPRPVKELKGFAKVVLAPGETKRVAVALDPRAFSYYDVERKRWRADGRYEVFVGGSSAEAELRAPIAPPPVPAKAK